MENKIVEVVVEQLLFWFRSQIFTEFMILLVRQQNVDSILNFMVLYIILLLFLLFGSIVFLFVHQHHRLFVSIIIFK